jgi:hypothetical protein
MEQSSNIEATNKSNNRLKFIYETKILCKKECERENQ